MKRKAKVHGSSRGAWVGNLGQDIRYALRQLRNAPGFTLTATLTLALGIGATTAIFTLIHAVLLKSLPVANPEQLYRVGDGDLSRFGGVWSGLEDEWGIFSYDAYKYLRDHTTGLDEIAGFQGEPRRVGVRRAGSPDAAQSHYGEYVSGNYFATLGVGAFAGRALIPEDDRAGAAPVAMISYRAYEQKYARDPSVVGSTFNLNGAPLIIVGVTPPGFFGDTLRNNPPDFWMPLSTEPIINRGPWIDNPDLHFLYIIGRLRPGGQREAINARLKVELQQWLATRASGMSAEDRAQISRQTVRLTPAGGGMTSLRNTYASGLRLLMTVSGFVLLIVCANIANLVLVRGLGRKAQMSISVALGAPRSRLIRQALTESLVLALIGGAGGLAIAFAGTRTLLSAVFTGSSYVPISPDPDLAVLLFAFGVSLATGVLFGIVPAWMASKADPVEALRGGNRSTREAGSLPQRTLVVVQAALSLVLLAASGLLLESLRNLENQRFGFSTANRLAVRFDPNLAGYQPQQLEPLYRKIKDRLTQVPGVQKVALALYSPMGGGGWSGQVILEGQARLASNQAQTVSWWDRIAADYFETLGTRILRGRTITEQDTASTRHVAVVNETFARRFYKNEDPLGKHFGKSAPKYAGDYEIVGVVEDAKYRSPQLPVVPMYFLPATQTTRYDDPADNAFEARSMYLTDMVLRLEARDESIGARILQAFAEIDPNLTVIRVQDLDTQVNNNLNQPQLIARLTVLFGLTALMLASIGLYGMTSYTVQRRRKEIGIRMALGADRREVLRMVLRSAFALTGIGLAIGVPLTIAMGRVLSSSLFGMNGFSPVALGGSALLLGIFALIASIAPARRAASIDPIRALRTE